MNKKRIAKNIAYWSGVVILGLVIGFSIQFVAAWTEPSTNPPGGNLGAPINTSEIQQAKLGNFIAQNLGSFNLTLVQKGYSASTTADDPGNTLVTKDYVDAQSVSGGGWIFLNDTSSVSSGKATATVTCPDGMKIIGYHGARTCGSDSNSCDDKHLTLGYIDNRAPVSGGTSLCSAKGCTPVTLGESTSLSCWAQLSFSFPGVACAFVSVICGK